MNTRIGPVLLATLLPAASLAANSPPDSGQEWRFQVSLGDKPIGYHDFQLTRHGVQSQVRSKASFDVRYWFIDAYSYRHHNAETWQGNCLASLDSSTDDNGKHFKVRGEEEGGRFVVDTGKGERRLPSCVMSFAYWNERFLRQDHLLNPQTGEYLPVTVTAEGKESIHAEGRLLKAARYRVKARDFTIDVWYGPDGRWLALDSTTEDGHTLHYRLR